ncbi:MAG TPA: ATP-binding protein [Opitutaceae bacterium]|jgi:PAS domain S-box-containing protein|nr:ATP-binding protein [Opitutaceae bacterium]
MSEVNPSLAGDEDRFRTLARHAPVGIFLTDPEGATVFVNDAWCRMTGLAAGEAQGDGWIRGLHPADRAWVTEGWKRALREGATSEAEFRFCRPDGSVAWLHGRAAQVRAENGAPAGYAGVLIDVTARREVEASLRERTRTLEILNEVSSALVAEHDPARILDAVLAAGREISGAAAAAFDRRFPGAAVIRCGNYAGPAPPAGLPPDAPRRSYLAVPVVSRTGEILGGLFFGHSAPERFSGEAERTIVGLAAEAAIAIDNANVYRTLEQRVQERTQSLRDAITQMEEFSYSVSHDLRAPLRAMNGYAQALLDDYGGRLDATARGYLDRIQRSSERMEKLTYDLLAYSRMARGELATGPVNLDKLIADIVHQYVELQAPRSAVEIAGPLGDARGHESSLAQAAANLLTNAVKFVPAGVTPRVRVWTEQVRGRVRLWVADNGIGIKREHQARLFQVFERLPTNARYEGTGIGLAIVRKAMEKMGGSCGVESDGRSGSRFWLELPKA